MLTAVMSLALLALVAVSGIYYSKTIGRLNIDSAPVAESAAGL